MCWVGEPSIIYVSVGIQRFIEIDLDVSRTVFTEEIVRFSDRWKHGVEYVKKVKYFYDEYGFTDISGNKKLTINTCT